MSSYPLDMLNNCQMLAWLNGWEIVLILAVVMILFGAKRLPALAKGLGQGIKEFKTGLREDPETPGQVSRPANGSDKA